MSTKTNVEKRQALWMMLFPEISKRHPEIMRLEQEFRDNPSGENYETLIRREREIWGDVFPYGLFPVSALTKAEIDRLSHQERMNEHEVLLRIDLRYSLEDIMSMVHQNIAEEHGNYRVKAKNKFIRKHVDKWFRYLQVYDLRMGRTTWVMHEYGLIPIKKKNLSIDEDGFYEFKPLNIEMIAKYVYQMEIDPLDPRSIRKACNRIIKDYLAALELISGRNPEVLKGTGEVTPPPKDCTDLKVWDEYLRKTVERPQKELSAGTELSVRVKTGRVLPHKDSDSQFRII